MLLDGSAQLSHLREGRGGVLSHDQEWLGVRLALTWVLVFILLLTHRDTLGKFSLFTAPWSYQG